MQIRFYPYDFEYRIIDEKVYVRLFSRLESGDTICVQQQYQPYFFAEFHQIDQQLIEKKLQGLTIEEKSIVAKVLSWEIVEKELLGKKSKFWKIYTNLPKAVPLISSQLESWGIKCYEKDILFVHRYLRDTGIIPLTLSKAEGDFVESNIPLFVTDKVEDAGKDTSENWKILAIDIETYSVNKEIDPEKNPVLMIAFYGVDNGKEFKKVITWKNFSTKLDYLEVVDDEVELLKACKKVIKDFSPNIITGYYTDGFDFPYLKARADKHDVNLNLGLDNSSLIVRSRGGNSEAKITGMLHLDVFKFVRNIIRTSLKTDSFSLDAVSEELLGHKKHDVNLDELAHIWDEEPDKLDDFCAYNLHDAHLVFKLCEKLFPSMIEFTKLLGLPTSDIIRMRFSRLVESYILKRTLEYNVIAPNRPGREEIEQRSEETYQGGFVFEPKPGLYEDVVVFDFRSLYPTIISAHNIGPESLNCSCCGENKVPGKEEYWFCEKEKKFIPLVLERLILRRVSLKRLIKEAKEKNDPTKLLEARSYALKTLANSFYGYLGFFGARWYCLECARSTTAYARNYIQTTINKAEEKGFEVIYGDTDSMFMMLGEKHLSEAKEFMNEINFDLPGHMELEFEGYFPRGIFVALKGSDRGAKKRYALIDEQSKIKITGFETVRRNTSLLAKEAQKKVLTLILNDEAEQALQYIKETIAELKAGNTPLDKLIIKTQITRELEKYTSIGPHVYIAKKLVEKGQKVLPGMSVRYIIGKGPGLVRERARLPEETKEYDPNYYLNNQLLPAVVGIFAVLGISEEEILGEGKQTGLGKFF